MASHEPPGAGAEVVSIEDIREKTATFICKLIKEKFPEAKTVLDVGCSSGHFLRVAEASGFLATGLEPDTHQADKAKTDGHDVINGFFPGAEGIVNKKYDVITFNDSFEHIPDLHKILQGIKDHLAQDGIAIIIQPSGDGLFFCIALLLYKLGVKAPFDRLWQKGFASPHLHLFTPHNCRRLFENNGFTTRYTVPVPLYTIKGLWKRISCKSSFILSVFAWFGMVVLYPLAILKNDNFIAVFSVVNGKMVEPDQ